MQVQIPQYKSHHLIGISVLAVGVAMGIVQYKIPTIMIEIMGMFDLTAEGGSELMSILAVMMIVTALLFGSLSQKYDPKKLLLLAAGLTIIGCVVAVVSDLGWVLILSRAIEGIAISIVSTCAPLVIRNHVHPERIGSALGIWGMWGPLGSTIAALLTPTLFLRFGFVVLWIIYALVVVITTVIMYVVVKDKKTEGQGESKDASQLQPSTEQQPLTKARYREVFTKNSLLFLVGFAAFNMCLLAVLGFVPTILQKQGMDATVSGLVSTTPMILSLLSSPLFGFLSDRTGKTKELLVVCMAALGPCTFLLYTQTGAVMWASAILMGLLGMGTAGLIVNAFFKALPHAGLVMIGMGVLTLVQGIGQFAGTFFVQWLLGPNLTEVFLAGGVVMFLGFVGTACLAACKFQQ